MKRLPGHASRSRGLTDIAVVARQHPPQIIGLEPSHRLTVEILRAELQDGIDPVPLYEDTTEVEEEYPGRIGRRGHERAFLRRSDGRNEQGSIADSNGQSQFRIRPSQVTLITIRIRPSQVTLITNRESELDRGLALGSL